MPGRLIYGELYRAQLERQASDPTAGVTSRLVWNTTEGRAKFDNGSAYRALLGNDDKCVIGNHATASNNVRMYRSGTGNISLVTADDATAEGSASTSLAKLTTKLSTCLVPDYFELTETTVGTNPSSGSRRLFLKSDGKLYLRNSSGVETTTPSVYNVSAAKTTTYAILTTDDYVPLDATSAGFTATLPTAVGITGKTYYLKKIDSTTNVVTIATTSAQTIDGSSTTTLNTQYELLYLISDGSNWQILNRRSQTQLASYTPTVTGLGTVANVAFFWRRIGSCVEVFGTLTSGTASGSALTVTLPTGLSTVGNLASGGLIVGNFTGSANGAAYEVVFVVSSASTIQFGFQTSTAAGLTGAIGTSFGSTTTLSMRAVVPISGWND